ncbi:MAG TPA: carboxypeptidase-like regulatory domain-containing protein [Edaphobacter sp.]|nr:carboxypeptidase-like regulatory domain-containing protein [Edaphobacter sp.]
MKRSDTLFRVAGKVVLVSCSFAGVSVVTPVASLFAQQRGPVQRVVQGRVMDKSDGLLQGAVVYLKDGHSLAVKSFISNEQGTYRFGQLAQNTDYEIWAERDGKKSQVKTISSFDSKNQIYIDLRIDTGK